MDFKDIQLNFLRMNFKDFRQLTKATEEQI